MTPSRVMIVGIYIYILNWKGGVLVINSILIVRSRKAINECTINKCECVLVT